jgi:hypothetical protein
MNALFLLSVLVNLNDGIYVYVPMETTAEDLMLAARWNW